MENDFDDFKKERAESVNKLKDLNKQDISADLFQLKYTYNFDWLGLPIIQYPQDIIALQEIIWKTKPDVIIETGVARGGSAIFYASMMHLLNKNGKVICIDIDIRDHNRKSIEEHSFYSYINLIEGSSIDQKIIDQVKSIVKEGDRVMVVLDSNHTHDHVLKELELYGPFVTKDCYCVVLDTIVEDLPNHLFNDRPWGVGNNPKTAIRDFMNANKRFEVDESISNKLVLSSAPSGYLKCISD